MVSLEVHQARKDDIFSNIIRLHPNKINELKLHKHGIIQIKRSGNKKKICGWLRTIEKEDRKRIILRKRDAKDWIMMDDIFREQISTSHSEILDFKIGDSLNFDIKNAGILGRINYYSNHSDPAVRAGFWTGIWLTIISVLAGALISIILQAF